MLITMVVVMFIVIYNGDDLIVDVDINDDNDRKFHFGIDV